MNIVKRREHYVPKTYLKPFSTSGKNNDMVYAYFSKQNRICFVAIDDVCVESYLYEHYLYYDDGETEFISPNSIENSYMQLENAYRPIIEKILSVENDIVSLTVEERNNLTKFMSSMLFRHPTFINTLNTTGEKLYDELPELGEQFANKYPELDDVYLKMCFLHALLERQQNPEKSPVVQSMKSTLDKDQLCVFKSTLGEFITSDAPVVNVYGEINGVDYDLVGMPISPLYFVAFINIDKNVANKVFTIEDQQILSLNKYQYSHPASSIIMSNNEDILRKQCTVIPESCR